MELLLKIAIFSPLLSGVYNGLLCKKITNIKAQLIASISIIISAIISFYIFIEAGVNKNPIHIILCKWIDISDFYVNWAIYVDQLTAIMLLLVTSVSAAVHVYSIGYMSDDKNLPKFLSYLSLFTFCMLALVSADNFLQLFFGWEGVGVCSYLLIGYYYNKNSANDAAVKAFIVNRVGDFAFIIGIITVIIYTGSVDFEYVFTLSENLAGLSLTIIGYELSIQDIICLMLFIGCMGKSAQIGMHVWLPDAMEGPTPVSALIHAATMVTAGIFLIARCSFMFEYSPLVLSIMAVVGAITCLFAALIAIVQTDIKKIIAYSTCSQLGYMFFACGVSAYQAGIFHLVTHGFFKALLFLSAGSVIHATHEQDIFKMGGLWKKMPFTYISFWLGSLAIIGIFPFAGFYSKDLILESAYIAGRAGSFAFILGLAAAILTAVYSLKIIILTFHGKTGLSRELFNHVHESPKVMNMPLVILIIGTIFSGMLGYYILRIADKSGFFAGSLFFLQNMQEHANHVSIIIELLPLLMGSIGALIGYCIYKNGLYKAISNSIPRFYNLIKNKFFFDEIYDRIFVQYTKYLSSRSELFDRNFIDRFGPNGFVQVISCVSSLICRCHTGYIFHYALLMIYAVIICVTLFIIKYLQGIGF